ncbi:hypothetical protein NQD34_006316 [Periophthalmus magnuspinnatus]|nr:hypothetical protein NQD34_006316 [Periophthalmus magnuspinnatus]
MEGCSIKNVTCKDIKNSAGYNFLLEPEDKSKPVNWTEINHNGTSIANNKGGKCNYSPEVAHCNNNSITTRQCRSLYVKYIHQGKGGTIFESCQKMIPRDGGYSASDPSTGRNWPIAVIILSVIFVLVVLAVLLFGWRKKRRRTRTRRGNSDREVDQSTEENHHNYLKEQQQQQHLLKEESYDVNGGDFLQEDENG